MFTNNPFAAFGDLLPPLVMQVYIVLMIVLVAAGTLFDIVHKGSAKYFFDNWRKSKSKGPQQVGGGELLSLAVKTGLVDVLASGEFCNARRRIAHLLTMYGFLLYAISTVVMVFSYSTASIWPRMRRTRFSSFVFSRVVCDMRLSLRHSYSIPPYNINQTGWYLRPLSPALAPAGFACRSPTNASRRRRNAIRSC